MSCYLLPGEIEAPTDGTGPVCASCTAFLADVLHSPTDEGPRPLCWTCRHAVVVHGVPLAGAWDSESVTIGDDAVQVTWGARPSAVCLCRASEIYPADVTARRELARRATWDRCWAPLLEPGSAPEQAQAEPTATRADARATAKSARRAGLLSHYRRLRPPRLPAA